MLINITKDEAEAILRADAPRWKVEFARVIVKVEKVLKKHKKLSND